MCQLDTSLTLDQLLTYCSDLQSPCRECAWREFLRRYKLFMYKIIMRTCNEFNAPRLGRQYSETVNDIFGEIFVKLNTNECKPLRDFRARDNEKKFRGWLAIICQATTGKFIRKHFRNLLLESDIDQVKHYLGGIRQNSLWILYEYFVTEMRAIAKTKRLNLERDIHIFMLFRWQQFTQPMIETHPCLKGIGDQVIDNVNSRMLAGLQASKN